ncbi:DNA translocase FtsK [Metabacillus herbersteinensis]|uniref:DNA translocase FtsK n=1 Tax=Metabacillus herbersteinensis TaxID=283816 RepID=A0ABV6GAB3_9BACI
MSWVSKFIQYFVSDSDEEELHEEFKPREKEYKKIQQEQSMNESEKKEIETKVSYQYPKGNFRFPLILDESGKKGTINRQHNLKYEEKKTPNYRELKSRTREQSSFKEVKDKKHFSPTEIPSPIYGFHSRYKQESDLYPSALSDQSTKSEVPLQEKLNEDYVHLNLVGKLMDKSNTVIGNQPFIEQEEARQNHPESVQLTEEVQHDEEDQKGVDIFEYREMEEPLDHENSKSIHQEPEHFFSGQPLKSHTELTIEEAPPVETQREINLEETPPVETQREINLEEAPPVETQREIILEETPVETQREIILEETPVETQREIILEETPVETQREIILEETPPVETQKEIIFEETPHIEMAKEVIVEKTLPEKESTRANDRLTLTHSTEKKSTIPFNVLMLNRDKQKMPAREAEGAYSFPSLSFLDVPQNNVIEDTTWLNDQKELLNLTLKNFNVRAQVVNVTQGPSVTRLEVHPEPGVKVNKITNLSDDIKLSLSAKDIRIEAPIPGKNTIGIEVPNKHSKMVFLREILRSPEFRNNPSPMTAVLGLDISGLPVVTDLKKMPHGLIAGATGSGKSVCINTILVSLLYKAAPHEVKLLLIDPKMVELSPYNEIPHLVSPVITDVKAATAALKWAVEEMERRYELFAHSGAREITRYNQMVKEHKTGEHLPYLLIVIDELADLMMVAPSDVEEAICRIAQKARACGIHLIVATQRPSVDVITGLIKANIPTRIAFSVSSQVDSRTIIDVSGAEKLLGRGDMLFLENGSSKAVRLQGTFVSDDEIERVVSYVKKQMKPEYLFQQEELIKRAAIQADEDELFFEACEFVLLQGGASASGLQRRFRIGYNRAARLMDMMEEQGIISGNRGSKPRDILITGEDLNILQENN